MPRQELAEGQLQGGRRMAGAFIQASAAPLPLRSPCQGFEWVWGGAEVCQGGAQSQSPSSPARFTYGIRREVAGRAGLVKRKQRRCCCDGKKRRPSVRCFCVANLA
eukprot:s3776_g8.t1